MIAALLRLVRVGVAQGIAWALLQYGGVNVPVINISVGAAISAIFKYLRDKWPNNKFLTWLPI